MVSLRRPPPPQPLPLAGRGNQTQSAPLRRRLLWPPSLMASAIFYLRDLRHGRAQNIGERGALLGEADGDADAAVERRRAGHANEDIAAGKLRDERLRTRRAAGVEGDEVGV